jgi:quinoprotein glucose dehydrogenase
MRRSRLILLLFVALSSAVLAIANPETPPRSDYNPPLARASDEAEKAIPRFQLDKSLKVEVWAAEPMLAHPVCFAFDEKGRCFVAETFRMHHGVTDTRGHMNWLDDDLACRTVVDRVAKYRKFAGKNFNETYEKERDRVRRLEDTTGSGKADRSTVFRDDFGRAEDGLGAGLLARNGNVYFTCIPDLWLLKDTKGVGTADVKESLATGFGVHTGFIGHDLHGLRIGPDGRLYFSIGDRGLNVKTKEGKHLYCPDSGAVLRCELDGSKLEIFATGLRNPQELAFDDFGNLFTVDNNSDSGDQARFLHLVEGGDYGWRMGYQYETRMHDSSVKQGNRGPWNYEQLWTPGPQAAYLLPALKNYSNGPSGFTAYPGVGLPDRYKGHFFLANFSGGPGASGIYSFGIKPKGATFEMTDDHKFVWNILATDCEFGPDGAFYISDWVDGWNINGKGRIYKLTDPEATKGPAVAEARKLISEGVEKKSSDELVKLLGHRHRGVRMEAEFELASRRGARLSFSGAMNSPNQLARLHAIWGLSIVGRKDPDAFIDLSRYLSDPDPEVRASVVKALGEDPNDYWWEKVVGKLDDGEPRVRMAAALALARSRADPSSSIGRLKATKVHEGIVALLQENDDKDAWIRHAGIEALAKQVTASELITPINANISTLDHKSAAVRLATVVALRRQKAPEIAAFLTDRDPNVASEAARAINDEPIAPALPKLADLLSRPQLPNVIGYRALNAHFLLGQRPNAEALAEFAARADAPVALRALAARMLGDWSKPPRRDYITGLTQELPCRSKDDAINALGGVLDKVFAGPDEVRRETIATSRRLQLHKASPFLADLVSDSKAASQVRIDALAALASLSDPRLAGAARRAVASDDADVRTAGRGLLYRTDPAGVMKEFRAVLAGSNVAEQQGTFALFSQLPSPEADAIIEEWLDKVIANMAKPELALEILEAAAASKSERIKRLLAGYENARSKDELGKYREALAGGSARRGREIFLHKAEVQCQRCHSLDGHGGEVGPPVNGVGKQTREYLLEALVLPNKAIAKGYESVLVTTLDTKTVSGVLKGEDEKEVRLITAEGKPVTVLKADIEDRRATKSAMPDDLAPKLAKRELRDLVEFLSRLKDDWKKN